MALPLPPALPGEKRAGNLVASAMLKEDCERMGPAGVGSESAPPSSRCVLAKGMFRKNRPAGSGVFGRPGSACGSQASGQASLSHPAFRELRRGSSDPSPERVKWV